MWKQLASTLIACVLIAGTIPGCGSDSNEETVSGPIIVIPVSYPDYDDHPRWSPDGTKVLFFHSGIIGVTTYGVQLDLSVRGLWSVDMAGKRSFLLRATYVHGEISHAGDKIAISAGGRIYVAALSSGGIDSLSIHLLTGGGSDHFPTWSPGDSLIAYESNADSKGYRVHITNLTGMEVNSLPFPSREPSWFSDGNQIAYSWTPARSSEEVGRYDLETSTQVRLTNNGLIRDHRPSVSPSGDQILFQRGTEIWLMNADGSNAHFVIDGHTPTWAPDGAKFAFVCQPDGGVPGLGTLWASDVNGTTLKRLTGPYPPASPN